MSLTEEWNKQEFIEVCDHTIERLETKNPLYKLINNKTLTNAKINAQKNIKNDIGSGKVLNPIDVKVLALNRNYFWKVKVPESQRDYKNAHDNLPKISII